LNRKSRRSRNGEHARAIARDGRRRHVETELVRRHIEERHRHS
jgi:hypothetical protein